MGDFERFAHFWAKSLSEICQMERKISLQNIICQCILLRKLTKNEESCANRGSMRYFFSWIIRARIIPDKWYNFHQKKKKKKENLYFAQEAERHVHTNGELDMNK